MVRAATADLTEDYFTVAEYYGVLRTPAFNMSWEQIAQATDEQILSEIISVHRQNKKPEKESGLGSTAKSLKKRVHLTDEQRRKDFEEKAYRLMRVPKTPEGAAYIERMWQRGLENRKRRLEHEAKQSSQS